MPSISNSDIYFFFFKLKRTEEAYKFGKKAVVSSEFEFNDILQKISEAERLKNNEFGLFVLLSENYILKIFFFSLTSFYIPMKTLQNRKNSQEITKIVTIFMKNH